MSQYKVPALNRILITGNLVKDPELHKTGSGVPVANFRIASTKHFRDSAGNRKESTCFVGVVAWQGLAESVANYLVQGSAILVEGELQSRSWTTDNGDKRSAVEVVAHKIQFLDKRVREENDYDDCEKDDSQYGEQETHE